MVLPGMSPGEKKGSAAWPFDRHRLGRVNNGLSDKTKMTFAACGWQIRQVSCFVNKISCEKTKRSVMPVIRLPLLMFYGWEYCRYSAFTGWGSLWYKRSCSV